MDHVLSYILLLPLIIWSVFQAPLYNNATLVEQSLEIAIYEGQKEASIQGKYDENIYKKMRDYLVRDHHYKPESIEIQGTETLTPRGQKMTIEITVPKPIVTVMEIFSVDTSQPFHKKSTILSEYIE